MSISIRAEFHFDAIREALPELCDKAMEQCGLIGENYAKALSPVASGNLRNSITHNVSSYFSFSVAYIGTDVHYGPYVEMGTGKFVGGSPPWVYTPDGGRTFYRTEGQPPKPFIKPAVADHVGEYNGVIKSTLSGG